MTEMMVNVCKDPSELSEQACDAFCECARAQIEATGRFRVALAGGSTPKALYRLLSTRDIDWSKIRLFLGDERNAPLDSEESNYNSVRETLLEPAGIASDVCVPVPIDQENPAKAATEYEHILRDEFAGQPFPKWDLVLLGMGDDAHTASLFPETKAQQERERWFVENWVAKLDTYRLTLTYPAINSADRVWFLIAGEGKRDAVRQVQHGPRDIAQFPSQGIAPDGELVWWLDRDAVPDDE